MFSRSRVSDSKARVLAPNIPAERARESKPPQSIYIQVYKSQAMWWWLFWVLVDEQLGNEQPVALRRKVHGKAGGMHARRSHRSAGNKNSRARETRVSYARTRFIDEESFAKRSRARSLTLASCRRSLFFRVLNERALESSSFGVEPVCCASYVVSTIAERRH